MKILAVAVRRNRGRKDNLKSVLVTILILALDLLIGLYSRQK